MVNLLMVRTLKLWLKEKSDIEAKYNTERKRRKMKKYLITGCAGFIGSNFVYYMLKKYQDILLVNLDALT